jgi:hypothetical protein
MKRSSLIVKKCPFYKEKSLARIDTWTTKSRCKQIIVTRKQTKPNYERLRKKFQETCSKNLLLSL